MAITKIHPIKATLGKSIAYIGNDLKTENGEYISTFNCAYETAELEFELTAQRARHGGENQAYHLIQSFKPGEVTAEQCHEIGKKFADEVLGGKYEYVLCTHTDKGHFHNHIIFNAVSFEDNKRYRSDKKSYYRIRNISDKICGEYGLNIVEESESRKIYSRKKSYVSNKYQIKKAIDESILFAVDYADFLRQMKRREFVVREDEWLWFRDKDKKRFTKTDTIGKAYSRENIEKRIMGAYRSTSVDLLIDIERNVKCQQSKGYEHWATLHNIQIIADTLRVLGELNLMNYELLSKHVSEKAEKIQSIKDKVQSDKRRVSEIDSLIKNINTYRRLKPIYDEYSKKNPLMKNAFYSKHKQEIELFQRSAKELKPHTVDGKLPSVKQLESERQRLQTDISKQTELLKALNSEYSDLAALKKNVDIILGKDGDLVQEQPKKKPSILKRLTERREEQPPKKEQHKPRNNRENPEL